jgi:hypothetical protein
MAADETTVSETSALRPTGAARASLARSWLPARGTRGPAPDGWIAAAVFAAGVAYLLALGPFRRPLLLDPATWDYMSVRIAEGMVPYRDVFLHKTPGAALLGAAGAALAKPVGALPVHGAHAAFLALGAAGASLLYLLCRRTMTPLLALAAAVFLFAFDQWPLAAVEGVRAQVATLTLGLGCLLMAEHGRFAASGILGGAATLCWQPALAFLAGALCALPTASRRGALNALARMTLGALLPVAMLLGWFAATGALDQFFAQAVGFNFHYIALQAKTPARTLAKIAGEMTRINAVELVLLPVALFGALRARRPRPATTTAARQTSTPSDAAASVRPPVCLMIAGALYLAMTFISFQAWPDTILFGAPLAALLAAGTARALAPLTGGARASRLVLAVAIASAAVPTAARLRPPISFAEQRAAMGALAAGLDDDDTVVAVSLPEFLIHTGRTSRWPWPYLWFGVDRFAADHTAGGFDAILAALDRDRPALILIARHWAGPLRRRFNEWADARYDRRITRIYPHIRRPIVVYEIKTRL